MSKMRKASALMLAAMMTVTVLPAQAAFADTSAAVQGFDNGKGVNLTKISSYVSGFSNKDGGVAEIVAYDKDNNNAWVVNGATGKLDILSMGNVTGARSDAMTATSIDISGKAAQAESTFTYGDMTSVAVSTKDDLVAVALQDKSYDKRGYIAFLRKNGDFLGMVPAGFQPDMVTFTPDGNTVLAANEGEPRNGIGSGITDPKGSVSVIRVNHENPAASRSEDADFTAFDSKRDELVKQNIILSKGTAPSADLEPEYIAASNTKAYVTLQEANAIAVLDLSGGNYDGVYSMGFKDLGAESNAIDVLEDDKYEAAVYPDAVGAYMPDGIAAWESGGQQYIATANEGDAREWGDYANEGKVSITSADGTEAKKVRAIKADGTDGLPEGKTVLFGGRSFSIYKVEDSGLKQVYDSGNEFEKKTAETLASYFNCSNDDNLIDSRSRKKGPEAENVTVGTVNGKIYAFIGLERIGGIMVYDVTDPEKAQYSNYVNSRDFSEDPAKLGEGVESLKGDVAPEGLAFVSASDSPSKTPILLSAFEVSGTVAAYAVGDLPKVETAPAEKKSVMSFRALKAASVKQTTTSVKLSWEKVSGAAKYTVYASEYGKTKKLKKLTTTSGTGLTVKKITSGKLKKGKYYRFVVIATDGEGKTIAKSRPVYAATKGGRYTNVSKVSIQSRTKAKTALRKLKAGKSYTIKARQTKASSRLTLKNCRGIKYETSNSKIAAVSSRGKITGKSRGVCYIYAYAQNGVYTRLKVTVR